MHTPTFGTTLGKDGLQLGAAERVGGRILLEQAEQLVCHLLQY
jgi:hypothetical protein